MTSLDKQTPLELSPVEKIVKFDRFNNGSGSLSSEKFSYDSGIYLANATEPLQDVNVPEPASYYPPNEIFARKKFHLVK